MFETDDRPRVFALPPGADFPKAVVAGLTERMAGEPPEALARVDLYVNTRRMQRRLRAVFDAGPPRLLPRIRLVTELAAATAYGAVPPPEPPLRRRLELTRLIGALLDKEPDLAPRAALYDLADSLAALMDEMQGEGVTPEAIAGLDVSDASGYWQRSQRFLSLIAPYFDPDSAPDAEARQRRVAEHLARRWAEAPPDHPVIVAGSTGSRGATAIFMEAVARLPQGALILPGFDFEMPGAVWRRLDRALDAEDHPQYRFAALLDRLGMEPGAVRPWHETPAPSAARNRLISLALRPAPVTDQWMNEGGRLTDLDAATARVALVEAPSARVESGAIALALRQAAEDGRKAALITPDRTLTRQVAAALDRWGIRADDSAGQPLPLTAPGRFLRQVARLFGRTLTAEDLLALLKHPLTATGPDARGAHQIRTRELELELRRNGPPFPTPDDLRRWGAGGGTERTVWCDWLAGLLDGLHRVGTRALAAHVAAHLRLAEALAAGPGGDGAGALWDKEAGREARVRVGELQAEADAGGDMTPADYADLFDAVLQRGEVREAATPHPDIMIWGTLEARVQGADLVILAGLNEGVWPEAARPDPWLNRTMRDRAGLLLPERRIGLSAHDFQQAAGAPEVILSRSVRDAEAQTVPSRWLNRLTNLLDGLPETGAPALAAMRARGATWVARAEALDSPATSVSPAPRPAPAPPVAARPKRLSITEIQTLIRDPYAIYARHVLRLAPLDPLRQMPDAPVRGTVLHKVLETFLAEGAVTDVETDMPRLLDVADRVLEAHAPWPGARRLWRAKLARVAEWFVLGEIARQAERTPVALERRGELAFPDLDFTLRGKIDRIDRDETGRLVVYDYKTGSPPTAKQRAHFDKQLLLAAMMAEAGAVTDVPAREVREVAYIGLGNTPKYVSIGLEQGHMADVRNAFVALMAGWRDPARGYTARRAMQLQGYSGDYDHLARLGEWDATFEPTVIPVGDR